MYRMIDRRLQADMIEPMLLNDIIPVNFSRC